MLITASSLQPHYHIIVLNSDIRCRLLPRVWEFSAWELKSAPIVPHFHCHVWNLKRMWSLILRASLSAYNESTWTTVITIKLIFPERHPRTWTTPLQTVCLYWAGASYGHTRSFSITSDSTGASAAWPRKAARGCSSWQKQRLHSVYFHSAFPKRRGCIPTCIRFWAFLLLMEAPYFCPINLQHGQWIYSCWFIRCYKLQSHNGLSEVSYIQLPVCLH